MTTEQTPIGNGLAITIEPCPIKYGDLVDCIPQDKFERLKLFADGVQVLVWDFCLTDDIRFETFIEVAPEFRDGRWITRLFDADPGSLDYFSRPKAVWLGLGVDDVEGFKWLHKGLTQRGIMRTEKVYLQGSLNGVVDLTK